MNERKQIPMQTRQAQFQPASVNAEARTATLVWTTGAAVRRYDWWNDETFYEELGLEEGQVRMERLNNGAPLLNSHSQRDLTDIIGVVERAWIADGEGHAEVRFSERAEVAPIFADVQAGIIRNVSVGYMVHRYETVSEQDGVRTIRAVDWTPAEISLVPVPADAGAGVRSLPVSDCEIVNLNRADRPEENAMTETVNRAAESAQPEVKIDADKVRQEAIAAERTRMGEITKLCQRHGLESLSVRLIEDGSSVEKARAIVLDELAERDAKAPTLPRVEMQRDETDTRRAALENVIIHRAGHGKLDDNGRRFVGLSLLEMGRKSLEAQGVRTEGMSRMQLAERALHGTGDFPEILANVANKTLRAAYQAQPRTFVPWTRQNTAVDFKQISRTQLGDAPALQVVNENGEFTYGTMGEGAEKYQLATYGRIIGITRQAIVNDDLNAFARVLPAFGVAAANLESDTVYGILNSNPNMADGNALFHTAAHGNLASANAAIAVASLGIGRTAMRKQKGINGSPINVSPSFLLVPAELETIAQQYTSTAYLPDPSSNINPFAGTLQVIAESRLSVATSWFLAANPAQIDTIEYSYLEGNEGVYLETRNGFEVDGIEIKARLDFAAKAIDWRGLWKNTGT
jgi:hypothetical protein